MVRVLTSDIIHKWSYLASNDDNCWVWRGWFTSLLLPGGSQTKGAPDDFRPSLWHDEIKTSTSQGMGIRICSWEEHITSMTSDAALGHFSKIASFFFRTPLCQTENIISLSSTHIKLISLSHFTTFSLFSINPIIILYLKITPVYNGKSLFPNICGLPLLLFFWLKWAGYLAVAGLNLLAQMSDRRSPSGV